MAVSISGEGGITGSSKYTFDTNVSVGGTLTYEDVTSVDSIGIITAQAGIRVTGGSVAIGTDTAATSDTFLQVTNPAAHTEVVITSKNDSGSIINMGDVDDYNIGRIKYDNSTDSMQIQTNNAERVRVDNSGNLLVGTTTVNGKMSVEMATDKVISFNGNQGEVGSVPAILASNSAGNALASMGFRATDLRFATGSAERMRITSAGNVGIGSTIPTTKLDVVGRIIKTEYNPGELIECLETIANGRECILSSGSYTPTNVTGVQDLTSSYAAINGSIFTYNVPVGTKRLVYDFWVYMKDKDVGPLLHFKGLTTPDGSSTYTTVNDSRTTWRGSTANADYQIWIHNRMVLFDHSSEDLANGLLNSLGGSTRKLKFQCREYSGTYEAQLHVTNNWDGGGTDVLCRPQIRISAYA